MATTKKASAPEVIPLSDGEPGAPRPRLHQLIIRNFRAIGSNPIAIELDDVVVLVGPNNAGKSSILRAYQIVMCHGSKDGKLSIDDFCNGQVDANALPEVELHTIIFNDAPGARWIQTTVSGEKLIRERWIWDSPNKEPTRQGFDVEKGEWAAQVPWGAPNIANSRRPLPHRIDAFASPDEQAAGIATLIIGLLKDKITSIKSDPGQTSTDYELVLERIRVLQTKAVQATEDEIKAIEKDISKYLARLFPDHCVQIDAKPEMDVEKAYTPFKANADILMGTPGGHFSAITHQGSGARRTLLWATLKYLSEREDSDLSRPHVLLLDEPEICLHPSAIREARDVLYSLPSTGSWQVMITSHSPIFIDLSKDNTTVIRVFRDNHSSVSSTTLYRPKRAKLSEDDKRNMKLLNLCDPYLHEFFFGGRQIIVEGDTEYTAFSMLKEYYEQEYRDVQVIRARGKGVIPSVARVLLQFSQSFSILHDTDTETTTTGAKNPAWSMNKNIQEILTWENAAGRVHLVGCSTNFEVALFGTEVTMEKPYAALTRIRGDEQARARVKQLFDSLLNTATVPPAGCIRWTGMEELSV